MKQKNSKFVKRRLMLLVVVFACWAVLIVAKQLNLQVFERDFLVGKKVEQQKGVVKLIPRRGNICDRNGTLLAMSLDADSIYAVPYEIEEPERVASALAKKLKVGYRLILKKIRSEKSFVWIKRKVEPVEVRSVKSAGLKGIYSYKESKRYYPRGDLAAALIGFAGIDNDGLAGLEYEFDDVLKGKPGAILTLKDAKRKNITTGQLIKSTPTKGKDISLTLDSTIQFYLEDELRRTANLYDVKQAFGIVIHPYTGDILAMASYPAFDLNMYYRFSPSMHKNRALQVAYEPGSTFKIVTVAAALESGVVKPHDRFNCEMGGIELGGHYFKDHKPFAVLSLEDVIAKSSNVGIIKVGQKIGVERLARKLKSYGFGARTGVSLPGENSGIVRGAREWSALSIGSVSMGQEISVNALQMLRFTCAVANGGYLIQPQIIKKDRNTLSQQQPEQLQRILSKSVVKSLSKMMGKVVLNGTGKKATVSGYGIAGKTGTAQKASKGGGAYLEGRYVSSFVGYIPATRSELAMILVFDEPNGLYYGGDVAAPAFSRVAEKTLKYLRIQPEGRQPFFYETPGKVSFESVEFLLTSFVGEKKEVGRVENVSSEDFIMPDMKGKSYREVYELMSSIGLKPKMVGSGIAVSQYPPPGVIIRRGSYCVINFSRGGSS